VEYLPATMPNMALHLTALTAGAVKLPSAAYGCSGGR
jgi:hypothetical protein